MKTPPVKDIPGEYTVGKETSDETTAGDDSTGDDIASNDIAGKKTPPVMTLSVKIPMVITLVGKDTVDERHHW